MYTIYMEMKWVNKLILNCTLNTTQKGIYIYFFNFWRVMFFIQKRILLLSYCFLLDNIHYTWLVLVTYISYPSPKFKKLFKYRVGGTQTAEIITDHNALIEILFHQLVISPYARPLWCRLLWSLEQHAPQRPGERRDQISIKAL